MNISAAEQARNAIRDILSQNRTLTYKPLDFSCLLRTKMSTVYNALSLMRKKKEIRESKKEGQLVFSWKPDRAAKQIEAIRDGINKNSLEEARLRIKNRFNELKAKKANGSEFAASVNAEKIDQNFDEVVESSQKKKPSLKNHTKNDFKLKKKSNQAWSSPTRDAVFECIRNGIMDIHSIAKKIGKTRENVRSAIRRTFKDGTLYRVRSGVYNFVENKNKENKNETTLGSVQDKNVSEIVLSRYNDKRLFTVIEFDENGSLLTSGPFDDGGEATRYYWDRKANGAIDVRLQSDCEVELNVKLPSM